MLYVSFSSVFYVRNLSNYIGSGEKNYEDRLLNKLFAPFLSIILYPYLPIVNRSSENVHEKQICA